LNRTRQTASPPERTRCRVVLSDISPTEATASNSELGSSDSKTGLEAPVTLVL
jgi:hypothetical protein